MDWYNWSNKVTPTLSHNLVSSSTRRFLDHVMMSGHVMLPHLMVMSSSVNLEHILIVNVSSNCIIGYVVR